MNKWQFCVVTLMQRNNAAIFFEKTGRRTEPITQQYPDSDEHGAVARTVAELGEDGWELVGTVTSNSGSQHESLNMYFKRPVT